MRIDDAERRLRVVLLDIEGTTTPIEFVTKTLFPYASENLAGFLRGHFEEADIQALLQDLLVQLQVDAQNKLQPPSWVDRPVEAHLRSVVAYCQWLIARDSKCTPLKILQGKIWQEGYGRGELHGEVYEDVPRAMARWKEQGRRIAIYSSGSVLAQQLLFKSTNFGDLSPHISGFFDTETGPKTEAGSYAKIAAVLGQPVNAILFLSDAKKEIAAAQTTGMRTGLCVRQPGEELRNADAVFTFDDVFPG